MSGVRLGCYAGRRCALALRPAPFAPAPLDSFASTICSPAVLALGGTLCGGSGCVWVATLDVGAPLPCCLRASCLLGCLPKWCLVLGFYACRRCALASLSRFARAQLAVTSVLKSQVQALLCDIYTYVYIYIHIYIYVYLKRSIIQSSDSTSETSL